MPNVNPYLAKQAEGLQNPLDFAGAANDAARVQLLINAISNEGTEATEHRLFLDEMSPACRDSLYVILTALKGAVS